MSIAMYYGDYSFSPVPLITIGKTYQKTNASIAVGTIFDVTLNGNLVNLSGTGGIIYTFDKIRDLREAFDRDGKYFKIECGGNVLFEGYPRVKDTIQFNESSDNWVNTCPYSLTLEFDHEPVNIAITGSGENTNLMPPYISTFDESWSYEFDQEYNTYSLSTASGVDTGFLVLRSTHDISAVGKSHWKGPGTQGVLEKPAWQWAKEFVTTRLGGNPTAYLGSGIFNLNVGTLSAYDHFRNQRVSETEGSFGVNETYVLTNKNSGVLEDFTAEIRSNIEEPLTVVSINGLIQGLEQRTYGVNSGDFSISNTKFSNASGYFNRVRDSLWIYPRAQALASSENITLNVTPKTKIIGKSPNKGQITYAYEYDNRPSNCITGAKTESIQINDENPNDVFSAITIMGRAQGPILQSFNTVTEFRRNVNFDVIMEPSTGCSLAALTGGNNPNIQVASILCMFENDLRTRYDKVYKERDTTFWEPKLGRYNRAVSWSAVDCTDVPKISLCSGA